MGKTKWKKGNIINSIEKITVLRGEDILDGGDVIAGFQCKGQDLFV